MAITGTFLADFSNFQTACEQAEVKLRSFETGSNKVEAALSRMTDTFSGRKVIQDATLMTEAVTRLGGEGGIAAGLLKLTDAELAKVGAQASAAADKLRAMGTDVPLGMQRIADATTKTESSTSLLGLSVGRLAGYLSVAAVGQWAAGLLTAAGRLQDLTERTGVSVDALQRFSVIAEQSGSSIDAVSAGVFQMGKRLAGGDGNAADAAKELGLSFNELRAMKPEEAFNAIGIAIAAIPDPMKQSELGAKLFGRSVQELIPVFKHLSDDTGPYVKLTAQQVGLLDQLGDAYVSVKASIVPWIVAQADSNLNLTYAIDFWQRWLGEAGRTPKVIADATASLIANTAAVKARIAQPLAMTETEEKRIEAELADARKAQAAEWMKILKEVEGVEQEKNAWTIKGLDELNQTEAKSNMVRMERMLIGYEQIRKADAALADDIAKSTLSTTNYQILKIQQWAAAETAAFQGTIQQRAQYTASVEALAAREIAAIQATVAAQQQLYAVVGGGAYIPTGPGIPIGPSIPVTPMGSTYTSAFGGFVNNLPKYAAGGAVLKDGPIYAHAGEFVTPAGGAATTINQVFNMVDTEANIVRRVSEALTRAVLNGRKVSSA